MSGPLFLRYPRGGRQIRRSTEFLSVTQFASVAHELRVGRLPRLVRDI